MKVTITEMKPHSQFSALLGREVTGLVATATAEHGSAKHTVKVSKLDDETDWVIDAHFLGNGMPMFVHGTFSRCTVLKVAKDELAKALDAHKMEETV